MVAGLVAATVMYALLVPVARGKPLAPDVFAARMANREARPRSLSGLVLQFAFGTFWGLAAAWVGLRFDPVGGSHVVQGLLWGTAAFVVSLVGFGALGLIPRPLDWREWVGHLLNHVAFGLVLGLVFLWWS